jgi:flagellar basal body-associated protein FliL
MKILIVAIFIIVVLFILGYFGIPSPQEFKEWFSKDKP